MKRSTSNLQVFVLASILSAALLFAVVSNHLYQTQIANAKKSHHSNGSSSAKDATPDNTPDTTKSTATNTSQQSSIPGAIQLSAKEASGGYRWINASNGAINPTMNFAVNTDKTIQLQNPTDTKHQLIIDVGDKQVTSGDIASGGSGSLSFKPGLAGIFQYHCLYHPTTMKGIIQVH